MFLRTESSDALHVTHPQLKTLCNLPHMHKYFCLDFLEMPEMQTYPLTAWSLIVHAINEVRWSV